MRERKRKRETKKQKYKKNHGNLEVKLERKNDLIPWSRLTANLRSTAKGNQISFHFFKSFNKSRVRSLTIVCISVSDSSRDSQLFSKHLFFSFFLFFLFVIYISFSGYFFSLKTYFPRLVHLRVIDDI